MLLAACAVLYIAAINPKLYMWGDNAHYIIVAKALATGEGFRDIHTPGHPVFHFPLLLFPVALAPIVAVFDYDLWPLKLFVALTAVGAVGLCHRLYGRLLDPPRAAILTLLFAVSPQFVSFSHQVMTEAPYTALSIWALLLALQVPEPAAPGQARRLALLSAVLVAACLTRSLGLALVFGTAAWLLVDGPGPRGARAVRAACVLLACVVAWAATVGLLGFPYLRDFITGAAHAPGAAEATAVPRMLERLEVNLRGYATAVPETVLYLLYEHPKRWIILPVLATLGAGFGWAVLRRRTPVEYYVAAYAAILLVYEPSNIGNLQRYVVPLIPFILYYFTLGLDLAGRALGAVAPALRRANAWLAPVALSLLVGLNLVGTVEASILHRKPEMFDYDRYVDADGYRAMAQWLHDHSPDDSIVSTRNTYIFHIWARRHVVWRPDLPGGGDGAVLAGLRAAGVDYLTAESLDDPETRAVQAFIGRHPADFTRVYMRDGAAIYALRP